MAYNQMKLEKETLLHNVPTPNMSTRLESVYHETAGNRHWCLYFAR